MVVVVVVVVAAVVVVVVVVVAVVGIVVDAVVDIDIDVVRVGVVVVVAVLGDDSGCEDTRGTHIPLSHKPRTSNASIHSVPSRCKGPVKQFPFKHTPAS